MDYLKRHGLNKANYDKFPTLAISTDRTVAWQGWDAVCKTLAGAIAARGQATILAIDCYTGVHEEEIIEALKQHLPAHKLLRTQDAFLSSGKIEEMIAPYLGGDDPIFGYLTRLNLEEFFDLSKRGEIQKEQANPLIVVLGPGAALCCKADILVYADMPRWEGQLRMRRGEVSNLATDNKGLKASLQYKRAFFIDWRVCDRHKKKTIDQWDYYLDTTKPGDPRLVVAENLREGLRQTARRPFRVMPFFDPGPWGGQWMRQVCDLPDGPPNYAWCFDCVPEENSLLLSYHGITIETPSINLVHYQPAQLLGEPVFGLFGAEFPIRFDFLDTMQGGNLSFQVHPNIDYAQQNFNLRYTQDESYYLLDAEPGAIVYLGQKNGANPDELIADLEAAQDGKKSFDDEKFAARFPAKKHDHFLIPSGTLHCSGTNSMVLEISATPFIFTFKLWDWDRLGLDGKPRPINLKRGKEVIRWERDEDWCRKHLVNQIHLVAEGDGWREEHTGLYKSEFIETRRHWFTKPVPHKRTGSVEVLNLVQGSSAVIESPSGAFEPYTVHYAETFIIPDSAGEYSIRPAVEGEECATLKAYVRVNP